MKIIALIAAILSSLPSYAADTPRAPDTPQFRPELHFTAARNWLNDPNGLLYLDGSYHLFFQYNPLGVRWGHMSWGHAVSRDLLHWHELGVAIPEGDRAMIFSGSIVVDAGNSSGFAAAGAAPLVAVYTAHGIDAPHVQAQSLAYSLDGAATWTQFPGNPVLDLGLREFRDPKVFWFEAAHRWIMLVALSEQHRLSFYGSADLKAWEPLSTFGPLGAADGAWECPDLFLLDVEGTGQKRWVLKVDVNGSRQLHGSGAQYFVGEFDGRRFLPDDATAREVDFGKDFYASNSWGHLPTEQRRVVLIGWMSNPAYAELTPTAPWRGSMSLPRELTLRRTARGLELIQRPIRELYSLRRRGLRLRGGGLSDGAPRPLSPLTAVAEVTATLDLGNARIAGLRVQRGGASFSISYDQAMQELIVNRKGAGEEGFSPRFAVEQRVPLALEGKRLHLDMVLDRSSVEVFANDGLRVVSLQYFPADIAPELVAFAEGGRAVIERAQVFELEPAVAY